MNFDLLGFVALYLIVVYLTACIWFQPKRIWKLVLRNSREDTPTGRFLLWALRVIYPILLIIATIMLVTMLRGG